MTDDLDEHFDLVRVNALPITPEGLREFANIMRESCAYDSDNIFHLSYQWSDKKHRHVSDMKHKICKAADRIEELEVALREIDKTSDNWVNMSYEMSTLAIKNITRAALKGKKDDDD